MKKFFQNESGATAIEYGLIAAAMGLALPVMPTLESRFCSLIAGHIWQAVPVRLHCPTKRRFTALFFTTTNLSGIS